MKIERLHYFRDLFKEDQLSKDPYPSAYKWECQEIFHREWDVETLDFAAMYDRALSHPTSGNLWGGNHQSAKSVMLEFIEINREFVRSMFRDLFSRQKDLTMRIQRFHFHCDQMLELVQKKRPKANDHFHDGYHMPTLYLAFRYPDEMAIYDPEVFQRVLLLIGAKNPGDSTLVRFTKVTPIFQSQLRQDIELMEILKRKIKLKNPQFYQSMWLTFEFYQFIANQKS